MYAAPPIANLLVIRSPDIHRAADFYRKMGLVISVERHGDGPEHYVSVVDGFVFEIYPLAEGKAPTTSTRIGFSVDDVDRVFEMVCAVGGTVVTAPHDTDRGRHAVVRDLDGHTIELLTPPNRDR